MKMINSRHTLSNCSMCGDMVICADCGNNCCNAMSGKTRGIKDCDCDEAYEHQTLYCQDKESVKFANDRRHESRTITS